MAQLRILIPKWISNRNMLKTSTVIEGAKIERFYPDAAENQGYRFHEEDTHIIMKVETHNHPTAIAPFATMKHKKADKI